MQKGIIYELANGEHTPNLGENMFAGITREGTKKETVAQVAEVTQNLMSVNACLKNGNRVVFDEDGSYIEDKTSGTMNWLDRRDDVWTIKLWVLNTQGGGEEEGEEKEAELEGQKGFTRQGKSL